MFWALGWSLGPRRTCRFTCLQLLEWKRDLYNCELTQPVVDRAWFLLLRDSETTRKLIDDDMHVLISPNYVIPPFALEDKDYDGYKESSASAAFKKSPPRTRSRARGHGP